MNDKPKFRKTILIDFDGVIHQYTSGYVDRCTILDPPMPGAFEALSEYLEFFDVYIFSTRCKDNDGISAMRKWFDNYGFEFTKKLRFTYEKVPAWLVIDDRVLGFRGRFPQPEDIEQFKPWKFGEDLDGEFQRIYAESEDGWNYVDLTFSNGKYFVAIGENGIVTMNEEISAKDLMDFFIKK